MQAVPGANKLNSQSTQQLHKQAPQSRNKKVLKATSTQKKEKAGRKGKTKARNVPQTKARNVPQVETKEQNCWEESVKSFRRLHISADSRFKKWASKMGIGKKVESRPILGWNGIVHQYLVNQTEAQLGVPSLKKHSKIRNTENADDCTNDELKSSKKRKAFANNSSRKSKKMERRSV